MRLGIEKARKRIIVAMLVGILLIPQASFAGMKTAASIEGYFIRSTR